MDEQSQVPSRIAQEARYRECLPVYERILDDLRARIKDCLSRAGLFPTCKFRVKSFPSLFSKRIHLFQGSKGGGKIPPVTDIIGLRLICPFIGDLEQVEAELGRGFKVVEVERKGAGHSFREFGYESTHLLVEMPPDLKKEAKAVDIHVCEVQIRTILQEAWAEVEHELVYKAEFSPFDEPMKRKLAALNANLTLSDMLFQELRDYQHKLTSELAKRRTAFFKKIEGAIDSMYPDRPFVEARPVGAQEELLRLQGAKSMDELLLEALNAHNREDYVRAIDIYSRILAVDPRNETKAVIHKHRGMAYFSESRYDEALEDFSATLSFDRHCYKAAYYRGVVHCVRQAYVAAVEDFNLALSIQPLHFYSLYRRSQAYYHLGDYPKALADCESALSLEPDEEMLETLRRMIRAKLAF